MVVKEISKSKLKAGDILSQLRFAFAADQESFKKAFSKAGIGVEDDDDLKTLAQLSMEGKDQAGVRVGEKTVLFNTIQILNSYNINLRKLNESGIKFID